MRMDCAKCLTCGRAQVLHSAAHEELAGLLVVAARTIARRGLVKQDSLLIDRLEELVAQVAGDVLVRALQRKRRASLMVE